MRSAQLRFLEEAAKLGPLNVLLWSDAAISRLEGRKPKFPLAEREYFLRAIRYVEGVRTGCDPAEPDGHRCPRVFGRRPGWSRRRAITRPSGPGAGPTVCPTACYGRKFAGPARRFARSARRVRPQAGARDRLLRLAALRPHPLFRRGFPTGRPVRGRRARCEHQAAEGRRASLVSRQRAAHLVQSVRYVTQALVSTGQGWLDAEPEIRRIKPHIYAVNEDGDRPEKRQYCQSQGIEYRVLQRLPKEGLPRRQSTDLRGF